MSFVLPLMPMVSVSVQVYCASFALLAACASLMAINFCSICWLCAAAGVIASTPAEMATVNASAMRLSAGVA